MTTSRRAPGAGMAKGTMLAGLVLLLAGVVPPGQAGTFFDDFDDGNANGWVIAHNGNMGPNGYDYGHWYVQDQMLVQDDTSDHFAVLVPYVITSD